MQDEVNQKTVALAIKGGKITASALRQGLVFLVRELEKEKAKSAKSKNSKAEKQAKANKPSHGKQTLESLAAQDVKLTNIEITDQNIGSFDRVARKYAVDYALKKDKSKNPPVYYVFFKAKDIDTMTLAFKEYTRDVTKKQTRPSLIQRLSKALETVRDSLTNDKTRHKHQERSL